MKRAGKLVLSLLALAAAAQDSDQRLGSYRVLNAFELGHRSVFVSGSRQMYGASLNYDNGLRLLDGNLRLHSGGGQGRWIDEMVLTTFGAGGDPYQASSLRLEKNRFYRYDLGFRIVNYSNRLLSLSGGEHRQNTERIFQNHDLTLFPQRRLQILLGFDRLNQNGPALSSENVGVLRDDAFPRDRFFAFADDVRRLNNTWRWGVNLTLLGAKLSFLRGWDNYKEDTRHSLPTVETTGQVPQRFRRDDPVHGRTPFTRLNIHSDANRRFSLNGRFVYTGGERNFVLDETAGGPQATRQTYVLGLAKRTQATGDWTLALQPSDRWAVSNTTALNQTRISGDSAFVHLRLPAIPTDPGRDEYFFSLLAIRLLTNSTDVNFRPSKTLGFYGGYHYSIRRVQNREIFEEFGGRPDGVPLYSFENVTHSGIGGVRLRPVAPLTLLANVEYGRAGLPFTPLSERRYHAETAKVQLKHKAWLLSGSFKSFYNRNAVPPVIAALEGVASLHDYRSRQYSASLAWTPRRRFTADFSYAKLHLDTASGILNFPVPGQPRPATRRSLYLSSLHHGHANGRVELHNSVTIFAGYSIVKDTAGGRAALFGIAPSYPNLALDQNDLVNAYPLSFQSPRARLAWKLHKQVSWNAGWQYYRYREKFFDAQNYHAHVSYTSFRWSF